MTSNNNHQTYTEIDSLVVYKIFNTTLRKFQNASGKSPSTTGKSWSNLSSLHAHISLRFGTATFPQNLLIVTISKDGITTQTIGEHWPERYLPDGARRSDVEYKRLSNLKKSAAKTSKLF
jgi:hypothetical protein